MNSFFRDVIAKLITADEAFSGHTSFKIADPTAVGENPIREITLDAVPLDNNESMLTLAWAGSAEKIMEKKGPSEEINHTFQLISTDLSQIVSLTNEEKYDEAKNAMKEVMKTYASDTEAPVATNMPKLNTTQASEKVASSQYYIKVEYRESGEPKQWIVLSKATKNGPKQIDDLVEFRGKKSHAEEKLQSLRNREQREQKEAAILNSRGLHVFYCQNCGYEGNDFSAVNLTKLNDPQHTGWVCPKCNKEQGIEKESLQDKNIWKQAKITMQNLFFSSADELMEYQKKMKELQPSKTDQDNVPLWDKMNNKTPKDTLSPSSLSYEDVEEEKAKEHENLTKHIDETIKNELESALQEKAASVFGPADVELVKSMRAPGIGRNWDEVKKYFVKELNRDKDATTIFLDEQRKLSGDESVEVTVEEKKPEDALRPPENLVSPETHDKLLEDLKKKEPVEEIKEKEIEKVEPTIKEESAKKCPECGEMHKGDILKDNLPKGVKVVDLPLAKFRPEDIMGIPEVESCQAEILRADNADIRKVAAKCEVCEDIKSEEDPGREYDPTCVGYLCPKHEEEYHNKKKSSLKKSADDLNPLQEPIQEEPTMETSKQDVVPMGKSEDHQTPSAGDWVMVKSDLKDELPAFKAKFVSEYMSNDGTEYATVETEDQDLLEIEMHRVTKITDSKPAAQEADPLATPEIEMPQEAPVPVTPKLSDLSSSQDSLLSIKAEAEALLKDVQGMGKISFKFIKKGLEKHADDSAFEGNGWCRVWIQEDEIASDSRYPEILKLPDENAKIAALKELARDMAHEALRLADSAGAKVGVQTWFDSLTPSDHDRIDWVALANPQVAESSLKQTDSVMDTKCEECGEPLGPEVFLSKWPVCGKCTRKRHKKVTSSENKKADVTCRFCNHDENSTGNEDCQCCNYGHVPGEVEKHYPGYFEKKASDFEKGISQNKTSEEDMCPKCHKFKMPTKDEMVPAGNGREADQRTEVTKKADPTPLDAPQPTKFKELQKAPNYVDRNMAQPATQEMDVVLSKIDELQQKIGILERTKEEIQAKMEQEMAKIDQSGERVQMEAELQEALNKAGILIDATAAKVVSWRDKMFTLQNKDIELVPKLTQKELLAKIYQKFEGAEKHVQSILNGMLSLAKTITEKTLVRFPNKKSNMEKEASPMDVMNQINEELLAALKELSSPL